VTSLKIKIHSKKSQQVSLRVKGLTQCTEGFIKNFLVIDSHVYNTFIGKEQVKFPNFILPPEIVFSYQP
jgi:hypothetical protein